MNKETEKGPKIVPSRKMPGYERIHEIWFLKKSRLSTTY